MIYCVKYVHFRDMYTMLYSYVHVLLADRSRSPAVLRKMCFHKICIALSVLKGRMLEFILLLMGERMRKNPTIIHFFWDSALSFSSYLIIWISRTWGPNFYVAEDYVDINDHCRLWHTWYKNTLTSVAEACLGSGLFTRPQKDLPPQCTVKV